MDILASAVMREATLSGESPQFTANLLLPPTYITTHSLYSLK